MADEQPQKDDSGSVLDKHPQAAKMAAVWHVLSSATTDEEYEQAKKTAARIAAMTEEEVLALQQQPKGK